MVRVGECLQQIPVMTSEISDQKITVLGTTQHNTMEKNPSELQANQNAVLRSSALFPTLTEMAAQVPS